MLRTTRATTLAAMTLSFLIVMSNAAAAQQAAGISRADFDAIHADFFFGADKDFNLILTQAEIDAQMRRSPGNVQAIVDAWTYDQDGDGSVTYDEFTAGADAEFHHRDLNGDGFITPDEL